MGNPVDIDIVPRAHALLSASSAERWLTCTPSARIEEAVGDTTTSYAGDGTAAHAFAELRLRYLLKQITHDEYLAGYEATKTLHAEFVDQWVLSDWEAITSYVDYVMFEANRLEARVVIEARVDYSKFAQGGFGTADALLISVKHKIIKAIDLKFGKGVPVSANGNAQAKLYTLGGLMSLPESERAGIEDVEWTIHQPRLDYVGTDSMKAAELLDWAEKVVAPAAKLAWEGKGQLRTSEKGCRFCKIAATCRARVAENVLIARRDFDMTMDLDDFVMGPDEIARILPHIDGWIGWANKLREHALKEVRDNDVDIPGYKLVRGRANRSWKPGLDIVESLKALGIPEETIFPDPTPPAPRSVAQLEKALGKKPFTETVAPTLVVTPLGTPALVPDTDPREAIDRAKEAAKEFAK